MTSEMHDARLNPDCENMTPEPVSIMSELDELWSWSFSTVLAKGATHPQTVSSFIIGVGVLRALDRAANGSGE